MGKKSSYTSGNISINGQNKASTYKKGNTVYTNYNMNDTEKQIFDFAQNSFLSNLPQVNVFSDETQKSFKNQLNAYKEQGVKNIENIYTPIINNLKNDIASRFGGFDNSSFLNKLNDIEDNRSNAVSSLAQNLMLKQNDLVNDELSRRYNYLNLLNGIQNQTYSNALNFGAASQSNSSSGNSYNISNMKNTNNYSSFENTLSQALAFISMMA